MSRHCIASRTNEEDFFGGPISPMPEFMPIRGLKPQRGNIKASKSHGLACVGQKRVAITGIVMLQPARSGPAHQQQSLGLQIVRNDKLLKKPVDGCNATK